MQDMAQFQQLLIELCQAPLPEARRLHQARAAPREPAVNPAGPGTAERAAPQTAEPRVPAVKARVRPVPAGRHRAALRETEGRALAGPSRRSKTERFHRAFCT